MPTIEELLNELVDDDQEKTASAQDPSETDLIEKIASSLTDEEVKEAEALIENLESEKLAGDYEVLGRFMARGFHDELQKLGAGAAAVTGFGSSTKSGDMKGMTGSAYTAPGAPGNATIAAGGDTSPGGGGSEPGPKAPNAEGQSYTTPQDGSNVLAKMKATLDSVHQPMSATKQQDAMGALKKIVDAAKQQRTKQHPTEVPSNLTSGGGGMSY